MLASPPNTISCGYSRIFGDAYSVRGFTRSCVDVFVDEPLAWRTDGSFTKAATANTQIVPRIISVSGVPTQFAMTSNKRLPTGSTPRRAITEGSVAGRVSNRRRAGPQTITCQTATRSVKQRPPTPPLGESARCDGHDAVTFEPGRQNSGERHERKERGDDSTSALEQFCGGHGGKHNCFMPPADRLELSCRSALIPSFRYKAPRQWRRAPCRR